MTTTAAADATPTSASPVITSAPSVGVRHHHYHRLWHRRHCFLYLHFFNISIFITLITMTATTSTPRHSFYTHRAKTNTRKQPTKQTKKEQGRTPSPPPTSLLPSTQKKRKKKRNINKPSLLSVTGGSTPASARVLACAGPCATGQGSSCKGRE